eukprot:TRINITY_DN66290_c0_g1_i1.p1 TRINITY_DN66290_c0_g1~~TRINITY_DN66290_c0_g1_i1.p1  ORF type:complete len:860 (+),score=173.36 TRINITY_DN66290_c0_g1_i1:90-2582(+)
MLYNHQTPERSMLGGLIADVRNFMISAAEGRLGGGTTPPPPDSSRRQHTKPVALPGDETPPPQLSFPEACVEVAVDEISIPADLAATATVALEVGSVKQQFQAADCARTRRAVELHVRRGGCRQIGVSLQGTRVTGVRERTPAAAAGFERGDELARVDGRTVTDKEASAAVLAAPERFVVTVWRRQRQADSALTPSSEAGARAFSPRGWCPKGEDEWEGSHVIQCEDGLWCDMRVSVLREGKLVAQMVLPLAPLLHLPNRTAEAQWFRLWPPFKKTVASYDRRDHRFESGIPEVRVSAPRKPNSFGYLRMRVRLHLHRPLYLCYLHPRPPSDGRGWAHNPPPPVESGFIDEYEAIILRILRYWLRLKAAVSAPPHWWPVLLSVWRWEHAELSFACLVTSSYAVLTADWREAPLWLWVLFCALSCASRGVTVEERHKECILWENDHRLDDPPDAPHTVLGQYFHAKKVLREVFEWLELIVCYVENVATLLNWTDPYITLAAQMALLALAGMTSTAVALWYALLQVAPFTPRLVLLSICVLPFFLTPPAPRKPGETQKHRSGPAWKGLLPSVLDDSDHGWRKWLSSPATASAPRAPPAAPADPPSGSFSNAAPPPRAGGLSRVAELLGAALFSAADAVLTKVPALAELQHRRICAEQIHSGEPPGRDDELVWLKLPPSSPRGRMASAREPRETPLMSPAARSGSGRAVQPPVFQLRLPETPRGTDALRTAGSPSPADRFYTPGAAGSSGRSNCSGGPRGALMGSFALSGERAVSEASSGSGSSSDEGAAQHLRVRRRRPSHSSSMRHLGHQPPPLAEPITLRRRAASARAPD